jgi:hypothetical protein
MPRTAHPAPRLSDVEQSSASSPASDSTSGASVGNLISSCITY